MNLILHRRSIGALRDRRIRKARSAHLPRLTYTAMRTMTLEDFAIAVERDYHEQTEVIKRIIFGI